MPLTVILLLNFGLYRCPICRIPGHYGLKAFRNLPVNLKWPTPYFLIYTLLIAVHQLALSLLDSSCLVRSPDGGPSSSLIMPSLQRSVSKNLCARSLLWWCIEFVPSLRRTRACSRLAFSLGCWDVGGGHKMRLLAPEWRADLHHGQTRATRLLTSMYTLLVWRTPGQGLGT